MLRQTNVYQIATPQLIGSYNLKRFNETEVAFPGMLAVDHVAIVTYFGRQVGFLYEPLHPFVIDLAFAIATLLSRNDGRM